MDDKTVLIVDDDIEDVFLIREAFRQVNPAVHTKGFNSCAELLTYLKKNQQPNMILLDLEMPVKNGLETLRDLKANSSYSQIPVVIFSSSKDIEKINACYELKVHSFVRKPFDYMELTETMRTIDFLLYTLTR
jgi:CheY-like chemotaxis protein